MRKQFYFSAMICVLLSAFLLSVEATDISNENDLWKYQNRKYNLATQDALTAVQARSLMGDMAVYYNLNAQDINKGKSVLLGSVLKGAATVTVTYVSGGATIPVTVIASMEPTLRTLGLLGSINVKSEVESAYESAISALQSQIWSTSAAIARYSSAHNAYSAVLSSHNSQHHGSGSSPSDSAHTIDPIIEVTLDTGLPSFSCPGGGCSITWVYPSDARTAHYARCGTLDDPYNTWLGGCYTKYYTCNSSDRARHKPQDCGLHKWIQTTHGWTETSCPGDYRNCTSVQQDHSTILSGVNVRSTCGWNRPEAPTDNTPNCPDCTSHCSSPCGCSTSGTCNGTMVTAACGVHTIEPGSSAAHSHRYISSCSETENGNTCTNTSGYYACAPHSHTYPAPPPAQTWPTCTACNASYNPNSTYHVNLHRPRECRFSGCGNSWHACSIAGWSPPCNNAYRKSKGWKCGAK